MNTVLEMMPSEVKKFQLFIQWSVAEIFGLRRLGNVAPFAPEASRRAVVRLKQWNLHHGGGVRTSSRSRLQVRHSFHMFLPV